jgi:hypothetical protein
MLGCKNGGIRGWQFWQVMVPSYIVYCASGWVDIGTGTKVPLSFVTYLSKVTKINEKSVLTE